MVVEYGAKLGRLRSSWLEPVGEDGEMEFCLESDLPHGGCVFEAQLVLKGGGTEHKSFGYRRSDARLTFRADGVAVGEYLNVLCFKPDRHEERAERCPFDDPWGDGHWDEESPDEQDSGDEGHADGHHSEWQAQYRV